MGRRKRRRRGVEWIKRASEARRGNLKEIEAERVCLDGLTMLEDRDMLEKIAWGEATRIMATHTLLARGKATSYVLQYYRR
jgi:hypothetical protein